mmetsp:Transcript_26410/g.43902  ORF Transcript_26410/g.43902 Transcript_26410/m.43902 type:complete len:159 (+) Transcript_26410:602-1078(+)
MQESGQRSWVSVGKVSTGKGLPVEVVWTWWDEACFLPCSNRFLRSRSTRAADQHVYAGESLPPSLDTRYTVAAAPEFILSSILSCIDDTIEDVNPPLQLETVAPDHVRHARVTKKAAAISSAAHGTNVVGVWPAAETLDGNCLEEDERERRHKRGSGR